MGFMGGMGGGMGGGGGFWPGHINYGGADQVPTGRLETAGRVLGYFRPYWGFALLVLACIAVTSLAGLVPPLLIRAVIDHAIPSGDGAQLNLLVLGMVAIPLGTGLIGVAQNFLNTVVGQRVMFDLRNQMYGHLIWRMGLRFFTNTKTGEIMSRIHSDVNGVQGAVTGTLVSIVTSSITVLSTVVVIFSMDWRLALLAVGILPFFIIPTRRVGRVRHRLVKETQEKYGELSALMQETLGISGILLLKAFVREAYETLRFRQKNEEVMSLQIRQSMVGRWFFMVLTLFGLVGPALIYWAGGHLVIGGQLTLGTVVAFVAYLGRLYGPASGLANVHVDVMSALALFERIFGYLDLEPEAADRPGAAALPPVHGQIRFEGVSFAYTPKRPALTDVSFAVEPGQLAALVGPSGAGKTTVTYLVPRLYEPTAGRIVVDGHEIRDVTVESLRGQIGMVTQETFLFHASIRENLRYARLEATDEEVVAACRAANIHDFIASLPDGYDTLVGERGYKLSGGEKQRIAIARVLLKDPRILILDEATSSLDSRSEALIQAALQPLMKGRTSLVIAHRLSTVLAADVILVLDKGRLVEQGTHAELLARGGLYARLYEEQFKDRRPRPDGDGEEPSEEKRTIMRWARRQSEGTR